MRIDELEKYLENVLATDLSIRASQEKSVAINNMLAACRNLLSLENICNSETLNDNYKYFMSSTITNFATSYVVAAQQRLLEFGVSGGVFFQQPQMVQPIPQPVVQPFYSPNQPIQPIIQQPILTAQSVQPVMQQTIAPQQPVIQQPVVQQPAAQQPAAQQPAAQQYVAQQPIAQNSSVATSQPAQPASQVVQPAAQQVQESKPQQNNTSVASVQSQEKVSGLEQIANDLNNSVANSQSSVQNDAADDEEEESTVSSSSFDFTAGLPGMGGNDGPAEGRDYLLNLLSKKNK